MTFIKNFTIENKFLKITQNNKANVGVNKNIIHDKN